MNMAGPCPDYTYRTTDIDPKGIYRISGWRGRNRFVEIAQQSYELLGHEGEGLSDETLLSSDMHISIDGTGNTESLNVSVAAGILLAEWWRQNKA